MTIPAAPSQITYDGDGVSLAFAIPFVFDTSADIKVIRTSSAGVPTPLSTGFSITGGGGSMGTCTMSVAPAVNEKLTLLDDPLLTQDADYTANDPFPAEVHEAALDRTERQIKRLHQRVNRSIRVDDGDLSDGSDLITPISSARANKFLAFDVNGNPTVSAGTGGGDSALRTDLANSTGAGFTLVAVTKAAHETAAGVTLNVAYREVGDPRRYSSIANWRAVYAQVDTLAEYNDWFRKDHAQHPSLTNAIVGFQSYDDAALTGTVGYRNTVFGANAMKLNGSSTTAGGSCSAYGFGALQNSIDNSGICAFGALVLNSLSGTPGSDLNPHNNGFGYRALSSLTSGQQNNAFGFQPLVTLTVGNNNHAFGESPLFSLDKGQGNIAYGYQANYSKLGGSFSHAFGYQALFSATASAITAITKAASAVITVNTVSAANPFTNGQPIAVDGVLGMIEINGLTGLVTAVGGVSGAWTITTNINSTGFTNYSSSGYLAGHGDTAHGYRAGFNVVRRGGGTYIGADCCQAAEPGYGNTIGGFQAGNTINTNLGGDGGHLNTAWGFWALLRLTSGAANVGIGPSAGVNLTIGSDNINIGSSAGTIYTSGTRNVSIGSAAGSSGSATGINRICIGYNTQANGDHQVNLGDTNIATIRAQVTSITAYSDERLKHDIAALEIPEGAIEDLPIAVFQWNNENKPGVQMGVIAQQLAAWEDKWGLQWMGLVDRNTDDFWEATPMKLLFPLIVAHQKQAKRLSAIEQRLAALERNAAWDKAYP